MRIAVTGSTGLIGSALVPALRADGHEVLRLVRRNGSLAADEVSWDPRAGRIDVARLRGVDAVVHLAGAGVGDARWTEDYKREIRDSRVLGTSLIAQAMAGLDPRPAALVAGSAIGFYGDTGDVAVDERTEHKHDGIHFADVAEEFVAETFALTRAFDQTSDVHELDGRWDEFR